MCHQKNSRGRKSDRENGKGNAGADRRRTVRENGGRGKERGNGRGRENGNERGGSRKRNGKERRSESGNETGKESEIEKERGQEEGLAHDLTLDPCQKTGKTTFICHCHIFGDFFYCLPHTGFTHDFYKYGMNF